MRKEKERIRASHFVGRMLLYNIDHNKRRDLVALAQTARSKSEIRTFSVVDQRRGSRKRQAQEERSIGLIAYPTNHFL